jgi:hypothetical protein
LILSEQLSSTAVLPVSDTFEKSVEFHETPSFGRSIDFEASEVDVWTLTLIGTPLFQASKSFAVTTAEESADESFPTESPSPLTSPHTSSSGAKENSETDEQTEKVSEKPETPEMPEMPGLDTALGLGLGGGLGLLLLLIIIIICCCCYLKKKKEKGPCCGCGDKQSIEINQKFDNDNRKPEREVPPTRVGIEERDFIIFTHAALPPIDQYGTFAMHESDTSG